MARKFKKVLSVVVALVMVFAMVVPVAAAPVRVEGQNNVPLGPNMPQFVLFADGQIVTQQNGQTGVIVWTPTGTGNWEEIKAAIFAANVDPGWLDGGYELVYPGFFTGVGRNYAFFGGQNHYFWVEQRETGWYAVKSGGTISNTIFAPGEAPPYGALEVTVDAVQTTVTTTRVEYWKRTITPTYTLTKYVSQNFSSVTVTTPEQWNLRSCPTVINERNGNPIHNGNVLHPLTGATYNPLVVRNSNHFVFASLCYATLAAGEEIELVLVVGNNFNRIGNGVVSYENGNLTITFEYELFSGSWGALSFNRMIGVPNNGNIHSIGGNVNNTRTAMQNIGAPTYTAFSHNITNNTVTIPAAAPTAVGNVYLYIHGTFSFLLDYHLSEREYVVTDETLVDHRYEVVSVTNPVSTASAVIEVHDEYGVLIAYGTGSSLNVPNLPPGLYTVTVAFEGQVLYETDLVVANDTTYFNFSFTLPNLYLTGETVEIWEEVVLDYVINTVIIRR